MTGATFVLAIAAVLVPIFLWSFRVLPRERWQILATVPLRRTETGRQGVNLTFYGFFVATAYVLGLAAFLVLASAIGLPLVQVLWIVLLILAATVPASRLVAWLVEGQPNSFTVSGGGFVGLLLSPWLIWAATGSRAFVLPVMAALAVGYVLGEGFGRLACISFGCCYGKPLSEVRAPLRRVFQRLAFTFRGATKKIAYASRLDGVPVVPIQAVTAIVLTAIALAGMYLFLESRHEVALLLTLPASLVWRIFSERLRADIRGGGKLSAYQWFSAISIVYVVALVPFFGGWDGVASNLVVGLAVLANPVVILALQGVWLALFLFTGVSMVTGSTISFHVRGG
jgi:prolipoprotein diacylglyceryltransferase